MGVSSSGPARWYACVEVRKYAVPLRDPRHGAGDQVGAWTIGVTQIDVTGGSPGVEEVLRACALDGGAHPIGPDGVVVRDHAVIGSEHKERLLVDPRLPIQVDDATDGAILSLDDPGHDFRRRRAAKFVPVHVSARQIHHERLWPELSKRRQRQFGGEGVPIAEVPQWQCSRRRGSEKKAAPALPGQAGGMKGVLAAARIQAAKAVIEHVIGLAGPHGIGGVHFLG